MRTNGSAGKARARPSEPVATASSRDIMTDAGTPRIVCQATVNTARCGREGGTRESIAH